MELLKPLLSALTMISIIIFTLTSLRCGIKEWDLEICVVILSQVFSLFMRYFPSHSWEYLQFPLNQKKIDVFITSNHSICHPCLKEVRSIRETQAVSFNFKNLTEFWISCSFLGLSLCVLIAWFITSGKKKLNVPLWVCLFFLGHNYLTHS